MLARRNSVRLLSIAVACAALTPLSRGATLTWIGGNVDWVDAGAATNWNPADEPDSNDDVIFNTANTVNLGSANAILSLTMSGAIDLNLNSYNLTVNGGSIVLNDSSTRLIIPTGSILSADGLYAYTGSDIIVDGGSVTYDYAGTASYAYLYVNAATVGGQGSITNTDALSVVTPVFYNNGTLGAYAPWLGGPIPLIPPAGTLNLSANSSNARIDLDGTLNTGFVLVGRNQTLNIYLPLNDSFDGSISFDRNSRLNISNAWTMSGGTMNVSNGYGGSIYSLAGTAYVQGATFTQSGGTITLSTYDSTLQFDAPFSMTGGYFVNNGEVIFNADATIGAAANFTMPGSSSSLTVNSGVSVTVNQADFNADGDGFPTNVLTVNSGGVLTLNIGTGGDSALTGSALLNGASLYVYNTDGVWSIDGSLTTGASTGLSYISGDNLTVYGTLSISAGSTLSLSSGVIFSGGSYLGDGLLRVQGTSSTNYNTTISVATFDFDGTGAGTLHTIFEAVIFTINSPNFDTDGDMDDPLILGGNGATLAINGPTQWTMLNNFTTNASATGNAYVNGSSRFVLQSTMTVLGNTIVNAPFTLNAGGLVNVASGSLTLPNNAILYGGTITGPGDLEPSTVIVNANSTISVTNLNMDRGGTWTINNALLTLTISDYDSDIPGYTSDAYDGVLNLNSGSLALTSGSGSFVLGSSATYLNNNGAVAYWSGSPISVGYDSIYSTATIVTGGTGLSQIDPSITFNCDAHLSVPAGTSLIFGGTANFQPVNGTVNGSFTGSGLLTFNNAVNVLETTTLDFSGGTIDLDGTDNVGNTIQIDAPFVLYAQTLQAFGKVNVFGTNTLSIDNDTHTGYLAVYLDAAGASWTLNPQGVLNFTNNTSSTSILLYGDSANLNGVVNVLGYVQANAPINLGGTLNITSGSIFHFGGGNATTSPNTIAGGVINGPGTLYINSSRALRGYGTINAPVDSGGFGELSADNGTLFLSGTFANLNTLGTADADGVLNIPAAWSTNAATNVNLIGGTLTGGTIYNNNTNGITGKGIVTAYVNNNSRLHANVPGTLTITNGDFDGSLATEVGVLMASNGGTLELRGFGSFGLFNGTLNANAATIYLNNLVADFAPGSHFTLANGGLCKSSGTSSTLSIQNLMTIGAGADSEIQMGLSQSLTLASSLVATLTGNLRLSSYYTLIEAGATFSGTGALINVGDLFPAANASIGVLVDNRSILGPAGAAQGRIDFKDFQQSATGTIQTQLAGTGLSQFDRIVISGAASLAGTMEVSLVSFTPSLGNSFNVLSAVGGISGTFSGIYCTNTVNLAASPVLNLGYLFTPTYNPTFVQLTYSGSFYEVQGGTYPQNFTGPNWELHKTTAGSATLTGVSTYTGPTVVLAGILSFNPANTATASLTISSYATASLLGSGNALIVPVTITGGTGAWTSRLDINHSALIVSTAGGADKSARLATLADQIRVGRNGGNWLGYGITSLAAAATPSLLTVALADNADLNFLTFNGRPVNSNSLIVTSALIGDADLSGIVDLGDFNRWFSHVGSSTYSYAAGDFDASGIVDLGDFNAWFSHVGATLPLLSTDSTPLTTPASALSTQSSIPEPATLLLLAPLLWIRSNRRKT